MLVYQRVNTLKSSWPAAYFGHVQKTSVGSPCLGGLGETFLFEACLQLEGPGGSCTRHGILNLPGPFKNLQHLSKRFTRLQTHRNMNLNIWFLIDVSIDLGLIAINIQGLISRCFFCPKHGSTATSATMASV